MVAHAREGAELVLASVHGGGQMVNVSVVRRILSRGAAWVMRRGLGVQAHTVSSSYGMIVRRSTTSRSQPSSTAASAAASATGTVGP